MESRIIHKLWLPHRLTQHKRFVPYGTRPNFCFAKISFMLGTLYDIPPLCCMRKYKFNSKLWRLKNVNNRRNTQIKEKV